MNFVIGIIVGIAIATIGVHGVVNIAEKGVAQVQHAAQAAAE
jgi:hypothetical protein